jgi:hypothetical protein
MRRRRTCRIEQAEQTIRKGSDNQIDRARVLEVRIQSPPAGSQVRTCLSCEFAFLRREAAAFRGCPGRDERRGRQGHAGRYKIGLTGGNISVGPFQYRTTGDEVGDDATRVSTKSGLFGLNVRYL